MTLSSPDREAARGGAEVHVNLDHRIAMSVSGPWPCFGRETGDDRRCAAIDKFPQSFSTDDGSWRRHRPRRRLTVAVVIAVDGPAASGKGTGAKPSGGALAMPISIPVSYRAVGLSLIRAGEYPGDAFAAAAALRTSQLPIWILRTRRSATKPGRAAGIVAAPPGRPDALVDLQRGLCRAPPERRTWCCARWARHRHGHLAPTRTTSSSSMRILGSARRLVKELQEKGDPSIPSRVLQDMKERDHRDRRRSRTFGTRSDDRCHRYDKSKRGRRIRLGNVLYPLRGTNGTVYRVSPGVD